MSLDINREAWELHRGHVRAMTTDSAKFPPELEHTAYALHGDVALDVRVALAEMATAADRIFPGLSVWCAARWVRPADEEEVYEQCFRGRLELRNDERPAVEMGGQSYNLHRHVLVAVGGSVINALDILAHEVMHSVERHLLTLDEWSALRAHAAEVHEFDRYRSQPVEIVANEFATYFLRRRVGMSPEIDRTRSPTNQAAQAIWQRIYDGRIADRAIANGIIQLTPSHARERRATVERMRARIPGFARCRRRDRMAAAAIRLRRLAARVPSAACAALPVLPLAGVMAVLGVASGII